MDISTPWFDFENTRVCSRAHSHFCTRQGCKPAREREFRTTVEHSAWGHLHSEPRLAWLPVSIELRTFPLAVFQNLIHLSAVPPPDARRPCWCGDHAIALTAAVCSVKRNTGCCDRWFQTSSWLSFPPEASSRSSCDHFSPQTWKYRGLRSKIQRNMHAYQELNLTSDLWPENMLT